MADRKDFPALLRSRLTRSGNARSEGAKARYLDTHAKLAKALEDKRDG